MASVTLRKYVKRYTQLSFALDALRKRRLRLPRPSTWEDLNDQDFLEVYRQRVAVKSIYALCCTMGTERYHHWWIFAHGPLGICIEFRRPPLQRSLNRIANVTARPVRYIKMDELNDATGCRRKDLPFIKRIGYRDEREWRIYPGQAISLSRRC